MFKGILKIFEKFLKEFGHSKYKISSLSPGRHKREQVKKRFFGLYTIISPTFSSFLLKWIYVQMCRLDCCKKLFSITYSKNNLWYPKLNQR